MIRWRLFWAVFLALVLFSCAGFSYRHYVLDAASYEGALRGPSEKEDLPLSTCAPDERDRGKCIVLLREVFYDFKRDYQETVQRLKECQARSEDSFRYRSEGRP